MRSAAGAYNQRERDSLEEAKRVADETETEGSIANALLRWFKESIPEEVGAILVEDYEPKTIYLIDVSIIVGEGVSELPRLEVAFDRVLGWALGTSPPDDRFPA